MKKQEMALISKLLSDDVRKPTALVHFQRDLSPLEQKIMTLIIFHCQMAESDKRGFYYIRKNFVREFLGWQDSRNYPLIYEAFDGIYNASIQWNFLEADKTFASLKCRLLVSLLEPSKTGNHIGFKLHPDLELVIKDPKVFAKLKLIMMAVLAKPKYSYAFYELFSDCYCRGQDMMQISLSALRNYLGIPEDSYPVFKGFKQFILKPNLEAINRHSDYFVTYKTFREGRVIKGLVFHIKKQIWQPPLFTGAAEELRKYFIPLGLTSSLESTPEPNLDELDFIASVAPYNIAEKDARQAIEMHGLAGAIEIRDYALADYERRKNTENPVRKLGAYMAQCFKQGHGRKTPLEREESEAKQREQSERNRRKELKQQLEQIKKAVNQARKARFSEAKSKLSSKGEARLKERFAASVMGGKYGESNKNAFEQAGWNAIALKSLYSIFLKNQLIGSEIDDYRAEASRQGQNYEELIAVTKTD